jgi:hypothetical protein
MRTHPKCICERIAGASQMHPKSDADRMLVPESRRNCNNTPPAPRNRGERV